jgi:hypothetical protein
MPFIDGDPNGLVTFVYTALTCAPHDRFRRRDLANVYQISGDAVSGPKKGPDYEANHTKRSNAHRPDRDEPPQSFDPTVHQ